ncbi:hypothetical protein EAX62_04765 [Tessaracoccus antarcticus]|uniref:TIGR02611 family protein n=2 Tax=Tessaracoccus antarcticus TaxID=2479848 RepID=A0A3M0GBW8_9ACTN|nr:hypothetical protein EAX62_04765 [Tessaracoccus antarcticus]
MGLAKRLAAEIGGYVLLIVGVAALFLPGPGLLLIAAGLALLSTQYSWADKLLHPLKARAYHLAAEGVQTWPRIVMSTMGALMIVTVGILWGMDFRAPGWWPIDAKWWLFGGWVTGVTMMASGGFALGLIVYSFVRFRGHHDHVTTRA